MPKIIIGLDPGSQFTGVGVVRIDSREPDKIEILHFDAIDVKKLKNLELRLAGLHSSLVDILQKYPPASVAIENVFLGKNAATAFVLGQARGVCMAAVGQHKCEVFEYAPRKIKKMLTGNGAADKAQVQEHLRVFYGVQHPSADACDALAIAICHARQLQIQERLGFDLGAL